MSIGATYSERPRHCKRPRSDVAESQRFKRIKSIRTDPTDTQQLAKLFKESDYQKMQGNRVWISKGLFQKIYPGRSPEDCKYIRVAQNIYSLGGIVEIEGDLVGVNQMQQLDLSDFANSLTQKDAVQVRPFRSLSYRKIKHMVLEVKPFGQLQLQGKMADVKLAVDRLQATIFEQFGEQFFQVGQRALLHQREGLFS